MHIVFAVLSFVYFCVYIISGLCVGRMAFPDEKPLHRIWLGSVASLLMLLWLPALFAFPLGFTVLAQLLALATCGAIGAACFLRSRRATPQRINLSRERHMLFILLPLFVLGVFLFYTHTILPKYGELYAGQSTFGDLPLHLGLVTSIGEQGYFPPEYSIFPGTPVGYPFLCDSISATFYVLGAPLRFAMLLPALFAYGLVLMGVYIFFEQWLKNKKNTSLATLLFFLGGGFGFVYFFDLIKIYPDNFYRIFDAFYQTPTNNVDMGMKWVNPIADMLIPQRATLFGWALLFPALYFLRRAAFEKESRFFIPLGILAGCLPLVHTHSFLALGVLSALYLFRAIWKIESRQMLRGWLLYGLIAVGLAAPQLLLFTFRQSGDFLQLHFNWANETDNFFWFYIKNLGLLFLLMPIAFYRLSKEEKWYYAGALLIWFLSEFIQFQPNPYDNNKLLFIWFAYTCGIVATLLWDFYEALSHFQGRTYIALCATVLLFLSGVLTLGRECVSEYGLFNKQEVAASEYIKEHTEPSTLFLTASNHNNAVAALTGRNILCGTGSYLHFHGLDYAEREADIKRLYEQPAEFFDTLGRQYGIEYVYIGHAERYLYDCDVDYFARYPLLFEQGTLQIFDVREKAPTQ